MNQQALGRDIEERLNRSKVNRLEGKVSKFEIVESDKQELKLFGIICAVSLVIGYFISVLPYQLHPDIGEPAQASETVEVVQSLDIQPELPPQLVEQQYSSNSVYNWQYAVDRWNECKNDVSFYNDWVNWYGEESAMQMCIITHSENGSRNPNKVNVNDDGSVDVGLFQINAYWHCEKIGMPNGNDCVAELKKPDVNLMVARQIYERQGWQPWYGRKAHLPDFYTDRLTLE